jgi:uncharacterized cupredoxin-like copper-binding protein
MNLFTRRSVLGASIATACGAVTVVRAESGMAGMDMSGMDMSTPIPVPGVDVTIVVTTSEFRIDLTPVGVRIKAGQSVLIMANNAGKVPHEVMVMEAEMAKAMAGADMDDMDAMSLIVFESDDLQPHKMVPKTVVFPRPGKYIFACAIEGHQGMHAEINIE